MTLYSILRDVSQIIHILEIWNFGGENSVERKKIGLFAAFSIEKETLRKISNILA